MATIMIAVTTVGANGSATGNATASEVREGFLTKVCVPDLANTADLTIAEEQPDGTYVTIWAKTNITGQVYPVLLTAYQGDGSDAGQKASYHVTGRLKATLAEDDAGTRKVIFGIVPL